MDKGLLLPYAERVADARMVRALEVPNGKACGCVCAHCRHGLVAKHGQQLENSPRPHFAHEAYSDCGIVAYETALHKFAKQLIVDKLECALPGVSVSTAHFSRIAILPGVVSFDQASAEIWIGKKIKVDVLATVDGVDFAIETRVTHRSTAEKAAEFVLHDVEAVEIDLSRYSRHSLDTEAIENSILYEAPRSWLYNRQMEELKAEAEGARAEFLEQAGIDARTAGDIYVLLPVTMSAREHLALVDKKNIRDIIEDAKDTSIWPPLYKSIRENYERFYQWPVSPQ